VQAVSFIGRSKAVPIVVAEGFDPASGSRRDHGERSERSERGPELPVDQRVQPATHVA
jgi:hypothetical protein